MKKMPTAIKPMLATVVDAPFDDPEWLFEIKWDGFRTLAFVKKGKVELKSRADKSFNEKFPFIVTALSNMRHEAILDGEVVVLDDKGRSRFSLLQNYSRYASSLYYYV